jgi:hypothetical protein
MGLGKAVFLLAQVPLHQGSKRDGLRMVLQIFKNAA